MPILSDDKLLSQWEKHRGVSEGALGLQHDRAQENHGFHDGDKMYYTSSVNQKGRTATMVFNKVKPYVDAVSGLMIQLRRKPEYMARVADNQAQIDYSEYMNGLSDYARANANLPSLESAQDREMLISGYAAIDTNILYEQNPDGEVKAENLKYSDVFWDPMARESNLLDARWVFRVKPYSLDEALKRFKGSKKKDYENYQDDVGHSGQYNPAGGDYTKIAYSGGQEEDLVAVYYYQYWQLETYYRAKNPLYDIADAGQASVVAELLQSVKDTREETSSTEEVEDIFDFDPFAEHLVMTPTIRSDVKTVFDNFGIELEEQQYNKRVYYTAIVTGSTILQKFKSPDQQGYTIKFKTAYYDVKNEVWYGMVDGMKEPSRYANKSLTEILFAIASNSKGGVMYEESAVDDTARFESQWATTKAAIQVNDGALSRGAIQPKAQAALPTGYEQIYQAADNAISEVSGVSREFLGLSQNKQVSALLESQRINQVVSTLATYFDSISLYQVEHARLMITFLRMLAQNSTGRLVSIIGADGARGYERLDESRFAEEYDVDIGEAPTSATQKQERTQTMLQFAERVSLLGVNAYPVAIDYLPIPTKDKQKLRKLFDTPPEQQAMQAQQMQQKMALQQQMAELNMREKVADISKKSADAEYTAMRTQNEMVDIDKTLAETTKTLAEAEQKNVENSILATTPPMGINVTV